MRLLALGGVAALLLSLGSALAQSTSMLMPEGSRDLYLGLVLADVPGSEGGTARRVVVLPTASGLWSNGVFAQLGAVGWDATDDPTMEYGPIATYGVRTRRSDDSARRSSIAVQGGVFYGFMFTREIHLGSRLLYGGGADSRGVQLRLGADISWPLGSHDALTLSPGVTLADAGFMRSTYGISARQAQLDELPAYTARAGVRSMGLDIDWQSELDTKFTLDAGLSLGRLVGSAAHSPLVARRAEATAFSALSYHF